MDHSRIEALRSEAATAGDEAQVALCDQALVGDEVAAARCRHAIRDAARERGETEYRARLDGNRVEILRRGVLVGVGRWTGEQIEDCAAVLGEDSDNVYEALDAECTDLATIAGAVADHDRAAERAATGALTVGDRVEAGELGSDDHDAGRILAIDGGRAEVGWDSGVRTWAPLSDLRAAEVAT